MPSLTHTVEIDSTKYKYLTQDQDGGVYAHMDVPEYRGNGYWFMYDNETTYLLTGNPPEDPEATMVDLTKPFTFINGKLKQMELPAEK